MKNIERIDRFYRRGKKLKSFSSWSFPIFAAIISVKDEDDFAAILPPLSKFLETYTLGPIVVYVILIALYGLGHYFVRHGDGASWKAIQAQLDILQKAAFPNHNGDINDYHRVTLFKYKKWDWIRFIERGINATVNDSQWPGSGWLIPVARSGHTGKESKARYWAPDDGDKSEGIAGKAWSSDYTALVENLSGVTSETSGRAKKKYCTESNIPEWMLDQRYITRNKDLPISILACPLKTAKGERWGVLVFDTVKPNALKPEATYKAFNLIISVLGYQLEDI